jgi:putative glutamine amidotransferase
MRRPPATSAVALIGLSTSEMRAPERIRHDPRSEPAGRELALGLTYPDAIRRTGAVPVVIPPMDHAAIEPLLDRLSGLCLSGGPDLQPAVYGAEPHPALGPTEPELDRFELDLVRAADARAMPVLAICRGMQVLNVARGGTLHQHVPDVVGDALEHRQSAAGDEPTHAVTVLQGSRLAALAGHGELAVNSFHHQAAWGLGAGLTATAWAPDGTVEALEAVDRPFLLGVQWHVECLAGRADHAALFAAFVAEARARAADRGGRWLAESA